jgi:hypothetical protein
VTMNVVVDRPEARWLPSRHRFAIARLFAFARLQHGARSTAERPEHLILAIDRDQSASEAHTVAIWVFVTTASYLAALLPLPAPLAIAAAIPLASLAIHIPFIGGGLAVRLITRHENHVRIVSAGTMGLLLIWSSYVAWTTTWARFVAWFFFAVLATNGLAALILWLLRASVQAAEERCVR